MGGAGRGGGEMGRGHQCGSEEQRYGVCVCMCVCLGRWGGGGVRDQTQSGSEGVVTRVEEDLSSPREQDSDIVELRGTPVGGWGGGGGGEDRERERGERRVGEGGGRERPRKTDSTEVEESSGHGRD